MRGEADQTLLQLQPVHWLRSEDTATVMRSTAGGNEPVEYESLVDVRRQRRASHIAAGHLSSAAPTGTRNSANSSIIVCGDGQNAPLPLAAPEPSSIRTPCVPREAAHPTSPEWRPREAAPLPVASPEPTSSEVASTDTPFIPATVATAIAATRDTKRQHNSKAGARQMAVGQLFARLCSSAGPVSGDGNGATAAKQ